MFYDGEQPNGWIRGKYTTENEKKISSFCIGRVWITNIKDKTNKMVSKDEAIKLVNDGDWQYGHTQKPISEIGLANIRASFKNRQYRHQ